MIFDDILYRLYRCTLYAATLHTMSCAKLSVHLCICAMTDMTLSLELDIGCLKY